jgi:hypothetical protein
MHDNSFDTKKKNETKTFYNENFNCEESLNLPFAVPGNAKLKLPIVIFFMLEFHY